MIRVLNGWMWKYRALRFRYRDEPQQTRFLLSHLQAGEVVVEIGAHHGACTYWLSQAVGPGGKVYAFESQPLLAARLRWVIGSRNNNNTVVESLDLKLREPRVRRQSSSLRIHEADPKAPPDRDEQGLVTAPFRASPATKRLTLDEYFRERSDVRIDLIRCDSRGSELKIFQGGQRLLTEQRPRLMLEWDGRHRVDEYPDDLLSFLVSLGYQGYFFAESGLEDIRRFDPAIHHRASEEPEYITNFVLLPAAGIRRAAA